MKTCKSVMKKAAVLQSDQIIVGGKKSSTTSLGVAMGELVDIDGSVMEGGGGSEWPVVAMGAS